MSGIYCQFSPAQFDPIEYSKQINRKRAQTLATVLCASFSPCGSFLVAGGDNGRIAIWDMESYYKKDFSGDRVPYNSPNLSFKSLHGTVNCIRFINRCENSAVLVCGTDTAVLLWPLFLLLDCINSGECPPAPSMVFETPRRMHSRLASSPLPEINSLVFNPGTGNVIGACGDCNAHEWDVVTGSLVSSFIGHEDYILCADALDSQPHRLITGANDGTIGIWDTRSCKVDTFLRPFLKSASYLPMSSWISSLQLDRQSDQWLSFGGGYQNTDGLLSPNKGMLGRFYLPSRTLTTLIKCDVPVHCIKQYEDRLYVVGADAMLAERNSSNLSLFCQTKLRTHSPYALDVSKNGFSKGSIAVGGKSPASIDVCIVSGSVSFSLNFC